MPAQLAGVLQFGVIAAPLQVCVSAYAGETEAKAVRTASVRNGIDFFIVRIIGWFVVVKALAWDGLL